MRAPFWIMAAFGVGLAVGVFVVPPQREPLVPSRMHRDGAGPVGTTTQDSEGATVVDRRRGSLAHPAFFGEVRAADGKAAVGAVMLRPVIGSDLQRVPLLADGRFESLDLPPGQYQVWFDEGGVVRQLVDATTRRAVTSWTHDGTRAAQFMLRQEWTVHLDLQDTSAEPRTGLVRLELEHHGSVQVVEVTVVQRQGVSFTAGAGRVRARPGAGSDFWFDPFELTVGGDVPAPGRRVFLRRELAIKGGLDLPLDHPLEEVQLYILPYSGGAPEPRDVANDGAELACFRSEAYRFEHRVEAAGLHALVVRFPGVGVLGPVLTVEVTSRTDDLLVPVPRLEGLRILHVQVSSGSGAPVSDCRFQFLSYEEEEFLGNVPLDIAEQDGGSYHLVILEPALPSIGPGQLEVTSEVFGVQTVPCAPLADSQVEVTFDLPASITWRVLTAGVLPAGQSMYVTMREANQSLQALRDIEVPIQKDGTARLGNMKPGAYQAILKLQGPEVETLGGDVLWTTELQLSAGVDTEEVIDLNRLGSLTVLLPQGEGGRVRVFSVEPNQITKRSTSAIEGRCRFELLSAGEYVVTTDDDKLGMPVTVSGPTQLSFEPRPPRAYLVEVNAGWSLLGSFGFRNGDRIVAVDGDPISEVCGSDLDVTRFLVARDEVHRIHVMREGREAIVESSRRSAMSLMRGTTGALGGRIIPIFR